MHATYEMIIRDRLFVALASKSKVMQKKIPLLTKLAQDFATNDTGIDIL